MAAERATTTLRTRLLALAERRLPALTRLKQPETLPIRLDRHRIYVLPTRFGILFSAVLLVMLLGALNYNNNPALLLTCLLGGVAINSMLGAFRNLDGLALRSPTPEAVDDERDVHAVCRCAAYGIPPRREARPPCDR